MIKSGPIKVLVGNNCQACEVLKNRINDLIAKKKIAFDDIEILDVEKEGRGLAVRYKVKSIPAMLSQGNMLMGAVQPEIILRFIQNGRI